MGGPEAAKQPFNYKLMNKVASDKLDIGCLFYTHSRKDSRKTSCCFFFFLVAGTIRKSTRKTELQKAVPVSCRKQI